MRGYKINLQKHVIPLMSNTDISEINAGTLDALNQSMHLSNKSKVYVHATFRKTLNYAIKRRYISQNPYNQFDMPQIEEYNYKTLNETEIKRMLECVKGTEVEIPVTLALCYGLRRGECLGIQPKEDLDDINNVLHIQRTRSVENQKETVTPCKTKKSNRYILLNPKHTKLLTETKGSYACALTPAMLDKKFQELVKRNNFPKIRFHDLRHSYATLMMAKGINPKIVSTILGHSRIDTTLDIYSHPDINMQKACLEAMKI